MRLAVVGNPSNRRVSLFASAVLHAGLPAPSVFPWRDVLVSGRVPGPGALVRIDSAGEDAEVDLLLRELGGGRPGRPAEHGEILATAAAFAGLRTALGRIRAGGGVLLSQPADILTMTDKPRCHALLAEAGIPVPPALPVSVDGYSSLRAAMDDARWGRVFVKPAHGSSASGVLALAAAGRRVTAVTSAELSDGRVFNNLRVRRYDDEATIRAIVDRLAPDGLHVERWFPKAALDGRVLDLRVVVIAGRPRHVVVRTSRSPMTNLHLGNARGDVAAVRAAAGERAWAAGIQTCARVAACFPRTLHVGVDLMFGAGWRDHAVAEVNAFGDLLPGVLADGLDTYGAQVAALVDGWAGAACAT
ncbi:STM4014 family protein [Actinoplanes sp. NEAU-A12]|uniref:STM4014 family protein n=1 Tax=Actinoplanes sandaracinus TaxID=3045177 RepID=A0ABT6WQY4_9ACTN|nr:STM4014 family protein [Actinoplanes sandaracinus]MDI6102145.1 STM4014 family protein [Actinoplanes sandaracinus]